MSIHSNLINTLTSIQYERILGLFLRDPQQATQDIGNYFADQTATMLRTYVSYSPLPISESLSRYLRYKYTDTQQFSIQYVISDLPEHDYTCDILARALASELEVLSWYTDTIDLSRVSVNSTYSKLYCDLAILNGYMQKEFMNSEPFYYTPDYILIMSVLYKLNATTLIEDMHDFYKFTSILYPQCYKLIDHLVTRDYTVKRFDRSMYYTVAEKLSKWRVISSNVSDFGSVIINHIHEVDITSDEFYSNFSIFKLIGELDEAAYSSIDGLIGSSFTAGYGMCLGAVVPIASTGVRMVGSVITDNIKFGSSMVKIKKLCEQLWEDKIKYYDKLLLENRDFLLTKVPAEQKVWWTARLPEQEYLNELDKRLGGLLNGTIR